MMSRNNLLIICVLVSLAIAWSSCTTITHQRQTIRLDGEWTIAKTNEALPSGAFSSTIPVPGLVDLAVPALDTVGTLYPDGWYWHKRTFNLAKTDFDIIELKIFKAMYHTKVYVNGRFAGENLYCFTPSYFDIKPFLLPAGQTNEIVIGVGCRDQMPDTIPAGHDFEKIKYIPGIYDHVEICLANTPFINNIQCVPDIHNGKLRVVAEIATKSHNLNILYQVTETATGKVVASKKAKPAITTANGFVVADFEIDMKDAKLWSPESPFLYELKLSTGADDKSTQFGMRSFRFDPVEKIALLNEKPYYMRGTNVCIYRFFEDPERGALPWDRQWPVTLHERFKDMHWSVMRYCIGFPPERWYEICDSIGFMLQDEYPYWADDQKQPGIKASHIAEEYRRWMRERWNHPSVVIWDAQNESRTKETGLAIQAVRALDLSNRPWENGWAAPADPGDPMEAHPYLYSKYNRDNVAEPEEGYKKEFFNEIRRANNDAQDKISRADREAGVSYDNTGIINEYGWIWLNRDGTTTTLTDKVYANLWDGANLTSSQRLEIYARRLAELTEYWRAHRRVAGVLHFCGLAYSRSDEPRGQTSDHWTDIRRLTYEPTFYKYVRPAFAPVGLMIDTWEKAYPAGETITVPIFVINDLEETFKSEIQLSLTREGQIVSAYKKEVTVKPYEVLTVPFDVELPGMPGNYLIRVEYTLNGDNVFSIRDIIVK